MKNGRLRSKVVIVGGGFGGLYAAQALANEAVEVTLIARLGSGCAGLMGIGKSRARRYDQVQSKVTFNDVAGIDEAENELVEIVDFLKDPQKYSRLVGAAGKACC